MGFQYGVGTQRRGGVQVLVREAVQDGQRLTQYLDDHEDYFLAKDALDEFTQSNDEAVDLADIDWP